MRHIWMFSRNKRRMTPLDTALILRAMVVASELGATWGGYQSRQNKFSKLLEDYGLKAGGDQRDANSGGSRTYEAQMRSLGLLYKDGEGRLKLTQAGQDLVEFVEPSKTFEYQILKFQYPSSYSMGPMVGIDPNIKIRPFLFLLKLANDPDLNGLSDKDMVVPVVFGKNDASYNLCKNLILRLREEGIENVIPDNESIRTPRTINNTYQQRINDICDIANTFKNVLQGSGLVDLRDMNGVVRVFPRRDVVQRLQEIDGLPFVDFLRLHPEQATLQYGNRLGSRRDTRRTFMPSSNPELFTASAVIYQKFLDEVDLPVTQSDIDAFVLSMANEFHLSREQILASLAPIIANSDYYAGARLIELSKGGIRTAEAFEKNVKKIFEVDFGYEAQWTGRTHRAGVGGYMDVFVVELGRNLCGIIDTKSMDKYDLPHQDVAKAKTTYINAAAELYGARGNLELKFVAYISHLIGSGAEVRARELYDDKNIPVSLISSYGLNSLRENQNYRHRASAVTDLLSFRPVNLII